MQICFVVDDGRVEVEKRQSPRGQPVIFIRSGWTCLLFAVGYRVRTALRLRAGGMIADICFFGFC